MVVVQSSHIGQAEKSFWQWVRDGMCMWQPAITGRICQLVMELATEKLIFVVSNL